MLTEVDIKGFKCFESLYLPSLRRFNLVTGKNAVGKSALLEALFMFFDRNNAEMISRHFGWRGIRETFARPEYYFAPAFRNFDLGAEIVMRGRLGDSSVEARYKFKEATQVREDKTARSPSPTEHISIPEEPVHGSAIEATYLNPNGETVENVIHLSNGRSQIVGKTPDNGIPAALAVFSRGRPDPKEEANRFSILTEKQEDDRLLQVLQVLAPGIRRLQLSTAWGPIPTVVCDVGLPRMVPLGLVGEGVARLFSIALGMISTPRGLVLIDEIENGIHHSAHAPVCKALLEASRIAQTQVVATTHSNEFLQAFHSALAGDLFTDEARVLRLERKGSATVAKTLDFEQLETALASGWEVR